ncbi:Plasma membrane t-SNARE, secretory vesicle fusion [Tulasnella sp. 418]|nr:Plasma membrane t-SNARE, secretory vesicle fusion [Tulasnella sp. 418]
MKASKLRLKLRNKWSEILAIGRAPPPPPPKDVKKEVKVDDSKKLETSIDTIAMVNALAENPHNISRYEEVMPAFVLEIAALNEMVKALNETVSRLAALHSRSLSLRSNVEDSSRASSTDSPPSSPTPPVGHGLSEQFSELSERARQISLDLCQGIREREKRNAKLSALASSPAALGMGPVFSADEVTRKEQTSKLKEAFVEAVENWKGLESDYKFKYRAKIERKVKIVKPKAKPDEVRSIIENEDGEELFSQLLTKSERFSETESKAVLAEVRDRRYDAKRAEGVMNDLAALLVKLNTDLASSIAEKENDKSVIRKATLKSIRGLSGKA